MNAIEQFKTNRYIYLSNAVSRSDCEKLTEYMFDLHKQGKLIKDEQCPLSDAIYGDPILDGVLNNLTAPLSKQLGIDLAPAYTYARIYRPGETLVKHKDRPSCEISGTMTLGFDPGSGIWPIFFGKDDDDVVGQSIEIDVGDLLMYHGNELNHWRPKYKGQWQVQVFFHYVDKNGKHAEWAFDKRPALGVDKQAPAVEPPKIELASKIIENGVMIRTCDDVFPGAATYHKGFKPEYTFTPQQCEQVLSLRDKLYPSKSTIGAEQGTYNPDVRRVDTYSIPYDNSTKWIFQKIATAVGVVNTEYYKYDLLGITHSLQLLHYKGEERGHYDWHIDAGNGSSATRKISLSIPLTDRSLYEGGDLELNNNGTIMKAIDEQGSITFFPSFMVHRVTPVTKGERWVIVVWIHGPNRFR